MLLKELKQLIKERNCNIKLNQNKAQLESEMKKCGCFDDIFNIEKLETVEEEDKQTKPIEKVEEIPKVKLNCDDIVNKIKNNLKSLQKHHIKYFHHPDLCKLCEDCKGRVKIQFRKYNITLE